MKRWECVRLADIFSIEKGKIGIQAAIPGNYDLVTTAESFGKHIEYHFDGDAVCIPLISSTGHGHASLKRIHHIKGKFAAGNILAACINKNTDYVLGRFVFYYLSVKKDTLIVPLMKGSANVSLKLSDVAQIEILLPSYTEQCDIVARLDAVAGKARQIETKLDEIEADAERLLAILFKEAIEGAEWRSMSEVAPLVRREVEIDPEANYTELGIRSFFKGVFHRRVMSGVEYTWQKLYWVACGDLIFSNIMAWEQAIAVAGDRDSNCIGNHRMLTCSVNPEISIPGFLWYYFTTADGFSKILKASPGTAARNKTLKADVLMTLQVPTPKIEKQIAFDKLQFKIAEIKAKHQETRQELKALLPSMLEKIFTPSAKT
jgi:restriction endonuclease S subunit